MSEDTTDRLIWIDVETTGLDPARHALLEVAVIVTDGDLRPVADATFLVDQPESVIEAMDPAARAMHEASGLLADLQALVRLPYRNLDGRAYDRKLVDFLAKHTEPGACPLAGSSVHFDRAFLARHMPRVHAHLHYRNFDVSVLLEAARRWAPGVVEAAPKKREIHRALPDLEDSLALARYLRDAVFERACDPPRACEEHGRCWAHSTWAGQ